MKKAVLYSIIIVAVCAFILRLCLNYASAAEVEDDSDWTSAMNAVFGGGTCAYGAFPRYRCSEIPASGTPVTSVEFNFGRNDSNADNNLTVKICEESACGATPCASPEYTIILPVETNFPSTTTWNTYHWDIAEFNDAWARTATGTIYYDYEGDYDNGDCLTYAVSAAPDTSPNWRTFVDPEYGTSTDVEIIDVPAWDGEVYIGAEGANIPRYIDCFLDQTDCQTWLKYTFDDIGYDAYLLPEDETDIENAVASSTGLELKMNLKEYFTLPTQSTATTVHYCYYIDDPASADNDTYLCQTSVYWTDEDDLGLPTYDIESACDDVATSTGDFWDDFRYGIECGFRKIVYWAFTPQPTSIQKIRETYEDAKTNFPISVYTEYQATFEAIEEYQGTDLTIPVGVWKDQYHDYESLADITLGTSTLLSVIDEDFYDQYYLYAQILIYLFGAFYVFYRLINLNKSESE